MRALLRVVRAGAAALLVACRDESAPARTGNDRSEQGTSLNQRHEQFKQELHGTAESLGQGVEKAHRRTQDAVQRAGRELGVRKEVLGTRSGRSDAGVDEP